jgi:hypothetical protein
VARHDLEAARFLSNWIDLKQKDGMIQALYNNWVLGRDARSRRPRWSVLRNAPKTLQHGAAVSVLLRVLIMAALVRRPMWSIDLQRQRRRL